MKKKILFLIGCLMSTIACWAYDFYAIAPSGQTLFYDINYTDGTAIVVAPGGTPWSTYLKPTGALTIPSSVTHNGNTYTVTKIQKSAFYQCTGLTSVVIPNTVVELNSSPGTSTGYTGSFYGCTGITSVTLPSGISRIPARAFSGCTGLQSITIPESVTTLDGNAFLNCTALATVYFNAPNCTIQFEPGTTGSDELSNLPFTGCNITSVYFGSNVTKVPAFLFYGRVLLRTVHFNNVTEIGVQSFSKCGFTSITFPSTIRRINLGAFSACENLRTIIIPIGVSYIGDRAFAHCALDTAILKCATDSIGNILYANPGYNLIRYLEYNTNSSAFFDGTIKTLLSTVVIGDAVTSVGFREFENCHRLKTVVVGSGVSSIGQGAFRGCDSLMAININNVATIGPGAFCGCSQLLSVNSSGDLTAIGDSAFKDCSNLVAVSFGESLSSIGNNAFRNCSSLALADIGDSLVDIGINAFRGCSNLSVVNIGRSVSSIGSCAFWNCDNLNYTTIRADAPPSIGLVAYNDGSREVPFEFGCNIVIPCSTFNAYQSAWTEAAAYSNMVIATQSTAAYQSWPTCLPQMVSEANMDIEVHAATSNTAMGNAKVKVNGAWVTTTEVPHPVGCANQQLIIRAFPVSGYHFDHWSNGNTNNPDTLLLTGDSTITAYFLPNQYTVTVQSNNESFGTVHGGGTFNYNDTITISATATAHYHFVRWSDGNTDNPRQYVVRHNATLTAIFAADMHQINVTSSNISQGSVNGGGQYAYGSSCTISATASAGYRFLRWNDGDTNSTRTFTVVSDMSFIAYFEPTGEDPCTITTFPYQEGFEGDISCWKRIDGNGDGYSWEHSSGWGSGADAVMPHSGNKMLASFSWDDNISYHADEYLISPAIALPQGQATMSWWFKVNGEYPAEKLAVKVSTTTTDAEAFTHTVFDITPTAANGAWTQKTVDLSAFSGQTIYIAFHHHDSYDQNFLLIDDIVISSSGTHGILDTENDGISVFSADGKIIVEGADGEQISVFDIIGRRVQNHSLPNGVYMVKIGKYPARKVVVIR